jgi:hypothetical protein
MMVTPLKFTDAPVQVFKVLLAFPSKLINFTFQAFPLLCPEKPASFACYIVQNISINLIVMLQALQLCLLPVILKC